MQLSRWDNAVHAPLRVAWHLFNLLVLRYCKLPVKEALVNIGKKEMHKEPYKSMNPLRKVPALRVSC